MISVTACVANSNGVRVVAIPTSGLIIPIVRTASTSIFVLTLNNNAQGVIMTAIRT